jgi:hypothetical protein
VFDVWPRQALARSSGHFFATVAELAMTIDYILDHVTRALGNLESQFQRSPNLKAVLEAIVGQVQGLARTGQMRSGRAPRGACHSRADLDLSPEQQR